MVTTYHSVDNDYACSYCNHSVDSDNLALQAREPFILALISLSELPTIKIPN